MWSEQRRYTIRGTGEERGKQKNSHLRRERSAFVLNRLTPIRRESSLFLVGINSHHSVSRVDPKSDNYAIIDFR